MAVDPVVIHRQPSPLQGSSQPGVQYMPLPSAPPMPECPPGLEYLAHLNQLLVHQQLELVEVLTGFETNNKYQVKNSLGQPAYYAAEENDWLTRNCMRSARPFKITIVDNFGRPVMRLERPLRCQACCCFCCLQNMRVYSPPGVLMGVVRQNWSLCKPNLEICDADDNALLQLTGPCCKFRCFSDVKFDILALDGETVIGTIRKEWGGVISEMFTDADNYCVSFPVDLQVKAKALVLATTFLIDFMYFEDNNSSHHLHKH